MRPLEPGLEHAADSPISVAEMVVDGRIDRLELDGALELLYPLVVVADPIPGPAERIDDIAVIGPLLDRALDHAHAFVEIQALIDPGIAEIVQHMRLVGIKLERLLEIGLGLAPLLRALEADAAEIEQGPVRPLRLGDRGHAASVGLGAFRVVLA